MREKSIRKIREELGGASDRALTDFIVSYKDDERSGVRKLLLQAERRLNALKKEQERLKKLREYEDYYAHEYEFICGIDEAGRGPLAGPVAAAAVILPRGTMIYGINDSKKLSPKRRESLFDEITKKAVSVGVGLAEPERIDEINILSATYEAMRSAIAKLDPAPDLLLNDAVTIPGIGIRQIPIVKGDAKSESIAAASIIAKVTRDRIMEEYDRKFPEYGFALHKGYGTAAHIKAIRRFGISPIHRKSFLKNIPAEE